jgi:hypothetical protein
LASVFTPAAGLSKRIQFREPGGKELDITVRATLSLSLSLSLSAKMRKKEGERY